MSHARIVTILLVAGIAGPLVAVNAPRPAVLGDADWRVLATPWQLPAITPLWASQASSFRALAARGRRRRSCPVLFMCIGAESPDGKKSIGWPTPARRVGTDLAFRWRLTGRRSWSGR